MIMYMYSIIVHVGIIWKGYLHRNITRVYTNIYNNHTNYMIHNYTHMHTNKNKHTHINIIYKHVQINAHAITHKISSTSAHNCNVY